MTRPIDIDQLNARYRHHAASDVLAHALSGALGRIAMVSSFGAESVALLHLVAVTQPATPVLFLDTEMLFAETLAYQMELAERLRLRDVRILRPDPADRARTDPYGALHTHAPDACCALRKTQPLARALQGFDGWITGRKRFQGPSRAQMPHFERDAATGHVKVNPLAFWAPGDVADYIAENRLPRHPLVARGYPSVGCRPCTSRVHDGEDLRAGRWRGQDKTECGIHLSPAHAHVQAKDNSTEAAPVSGPLQSAPDTGPLQSAPDTGRHTGENA